MKKSDVTKLMGERVFDLDSMMTATPSCLKVISRDGELLNMNRQGLDLIEAPDLESVLGANVYDLVEESHKDKFIEFNEMICNGNSARLSFELIGLKGTRRWMETYAAPYKLTDGEMAHIAITNDVTKIIKRRNRDDIISEVRKGYIKTEGNYNKFFDFLLEEVIKLTESEYGFIGEIKEGDEGPFLKTYAITDISWNEETKKFYEEGAPEGLVFSNLKSLFGKVITSGEIMMANDPGNHPDATGIPSGHPDLNAFFGVPLYNGDKLIAMVGVANREEGYDEELSDFLKPFFDVIGETIAYFQLEVQNKEKEKKLLELNNYLDLAVEGSNLGIWDWNIVDNSVKFDRRWAEMLGIDYETMKMELDTWESRVHPDDLASCYANIQGYLKGETEHYRNIHRMSHKDGHWVYILDQGKISERDQDGNPIRFTGTHLNITDQKMQEQELITARNNALAAEKVKTQFLANMSHEIRTPMNGILGMMELLNLTELNSEQKEIVETVRKSGSGLMLILNDILDLSKIESGKLVLEKINFDISETINQVIKLFYFNLEEKGLEISFESSLGDEFFIIGDMLRIKQVLGNLVSNAIKFTEKGGVKIQASTDKNLLIIEVKDTGIGINEKDQENLFVDFLQADNTTTRKYGGTGLGLSISKKLSELMDGRIELESKFGEGSNFKLILPLVKANKSIITDDFCPVELKDISKTYPHKILLVEDNKVNQKLVVLMLEKLGYACTVLDNGQEAINLLKKDPEAFDLIFMDMQMPILDGVETTKIIKSDIKQVKATIVAITANAFIEDRQKCFDAGMEDFISKPITINELKRVLISH